MCKRIPYTEAFNNQTEYLPWKTTLTLINQRFVKANTLATVKAASITLAKLIVVLAPGSRITAITTMTKFSPLALSQCLKNCKQRPQHENRIMGHCRQTHGRGFVWNLPSLNHSKDQHRALWRGANFHLLATTQSELKEMNKETIYDILAAVAIGLMLAFFLTYRG